MKDTLPPYKDLGGSIKNMSQNTEKVTIGETLYELLCIFQEIDRNEKEAND